MNTWRGISLALVVLGSCGGGESPPDPKPSVAVPAPTAVPTGVREGEVTVPAAKLDWHSIFPSEMVAEEGPPPLDHLDAAALEANRERLDEILKTDLQSDRAWVKTLQRRLSLRPDDVELRFKLAEFYYQKELPNLAELGFLTLLAKDDHFGMAHKLLADIYRQAGNHGRAIWHARRAHRDIPADSTVMFLWGWTLRDAGDIEAAVPIAEAGLEINPDDARVLVLLAMLRADDEDYEAAVELARKGIAIDPDHLRGHSVLGQSLAALGRDDEAAKEMQLHRRLLLLNSAKLLHIDPPLSEPERAAALAHYHQLVGRMDLAREELAYSFELEPDNPAARVIESRIAVQEGDELHAKELLEAVLVKHPGEARATRALANLLATATDESMRDYERAMNMAGGLLGRGGANDFEINYTLGLAEAALGYERAARRHLKVALSIETTNHFVLEALAALEVPGEE
jgi:tetratricopeptide (TPR) repeat protein